MAFWTKDRELELIKLWDSGLSASVIAGRMGAESRNMILGKAWRMNLMQRRSGGAEAGMANRITTLRKVKAKPAPPPKPRLRTPQRIADLFPTEQPNPIPPSEYDVARISFDDLEPHHCKWICTPEPTAHNEPSFCGCKRVAGTSYCAEHARRSLRQAESREAPHARQNMLGWHQRILASVTGRGLNLLTLEDA